MIHKNLTPFYWGPKVTSRKPPQKEMALVVRGTFRLVPGPEVVPVIDDVIDQGFMSGDTFAPEDLDREGPLTYPSDFADWKPFAEVLLKGTCYPPKGADVVCEPSFGVGDWKKSLRVVGPRTFKPGLLLSGFATDPEPFTHLPLTWEHAYGGPSFAANPIGKGWDTAELPQVEHPKFPVSKQGQSGVQPASFGPISPNWPPRTGKLGKKWGASWEKHRKPFFAEDFDWTYFQSAPEDQWLEEFPVGDEELVFEYLHPKQRYWKTRLPGLRVRALVRDGEDVVHDVVMRLDTIYADLDAQRLYLTWRGYVPCQQLDLSDIQSALIAQEPLGQEPLPKQHYESQLEAFEADPIGLADAFPPGFLEVAEAVEAAEAAERDGTPMPDLKQVAENLPAGCPFPPYFLAAVAGVPDPLGVHAQIPAELLSEQGPVAAKIGSLAQAKPERIQAAVAELGGKPARDLPAGLEKVAQELPDEQAAKLREAAANVRQQLAEVEAKGPEAAKALTTPAPAEPPPPPLTQQLAGAKQKALAELRRPVADPALAAKLAVSAGQVEAMPSLDALVGNALSGMDQIEVPEPPETPDVAPLLDEMSQKLNVKQARMEAVGLAGNPLMGLFALGHRVIAKAPRPEQVARPDMSPLRDGLVRSRDGLLEMGVSMVTLAPLTGLLGRLEAVMAKLPRPDKPPQADFAYQDLRGQDLSGQDLRGKSFARADLSGANLSGADLSGANLSESRLQRTDLRGANLAGATLTDADAQRADLSGANLAQANLRGIQLGKANLTDAILSAADLEGADLQEAVLPGAVLEGANLTDAWTQGADMNGCKLRGAKLEQLKGQKTLLADADLREVDARFADLSKADLRRADLSQADLSIAQLQGVKGDEAKFCGARWDMAQMSKSRFPGADFSGSRSSMGGLQKCNLRGADLRKVEWDKVDLLGAVIDDADATDATWKQVMLRDVHANKVRFVGADLSKSHATGKAVFTDCNFVGLKANASIWLECELDGSDFSHAHLREAVFQSATGKEVNFFSASLKRANLRKANFQRTRFVKADLCKADLCETFHLDNQFTGANCYDAKFLGAQIASCDWLEANLNSANFDQAEGAPR